jgi:AraC-like DNA-binding protein
MTAQTFMTLDEYVKRLNHYRGQLRRHKYAERNAAIREFYKSKVASEIAIGSKPKAAQALAIKTESEKRGISPGQVRRALNDTKYLMNADCLKHRIREIKQILRDRKLAPLQAKRIQYFEDCVAAAIQKGTTAPTPAPLTLKEIFDITTKIPKNTPAPNALIGAVKGAAEDLNISPTQLRRILDAYGIPRRRNKK